MCTRHTGMAITYGDVTRVQLVWFPVMLQYNSVYVSAAVQVYSCVAWLSLVRQI